MKAGWEIKRIGDICKTSSGGTPLKIHKDYYEGGNIPWLLSGEVSQMNIFSPKNFITPKGLDNSSAKLFPADTVLVAMYGANAGQVGILRFESATNQAVCGIFPNNRVITEFLYYYLFLKQEDLAAQAVGGAQPNISQAKIKDTVIPVPPLQEQRRIVAILDEAFAGIAAAKEKAEQNLKNAKEVFASHLEQAVYQENRNWKKTTVGSEVDLISGFPFKSYGYIDSEEGVRLLRGDNIVQGKIRWDGVKKWPKDDIIPYNDYLLCFGDVVLAMDRPWINAGLKRAQISSNDLPCLLVQRTARLRGKKIDNRFLFYLISSNAFIKHIIGVQTGIGVPHISGKQIKDFEFFIPPVIEQKSIAQQLDSLSEETSRLESIYQQKLSNLEELKKSLLQQAFSGAL